MDLTKHIQEKIKQAIEILKSLGLPSQQQNERSALTLLALLDLRPDGNWKNLKAPLIGVTPIMDWMKEHYKKEYQPNTRETIRRQSLHQFKAAGVCLYNPDKPDRPVNSPKACYQIAAELKKLLTLYNTNQWEQELENYLEQQKTLAAEYAKARDMEMIPVDLAEGVEHYLSPGAHSQLIKEIIKEFGARFAPGAKVLYIGDTGAKNDLFLKRDFVQLGIQLNEKGQLPDVVLYWEEKNWLFLIESVTSHGPIDGKRYLELSQLFADSKAELIYVTAFPDRASMRKYTADIAWETEVWIANNPGHLIHFNGDKFLGPYKT
ncbi:BsuBI/PstI restriction endonuclease [Saprospira grandis DSM 2844]|uniref:BsuBI/PstI restriction endonuclease n=1 Tax=Saprospira grandis DSM 2844 TaxID=694433 RepID=J0XU86_9BACT|nr:BsuBI/PstI family type II restriction endonuclease [Saprospira grandis]EJF52536.1 BsuBI/PstI restriction endonuclease [Saprospira grandis DSM 2844]